ncbi:MAG: polysaccharide deacetylase family protein [Flavobacteriales bacterium]|nr:polysaccharide deacetylase family protein [Flavobacteriales bacterium]
MYHVPEYIARFFPDYLFHGSRKEKIIYLTFDDGPIPEVTPWVLDVLKDYEIQATFFCVGENINKHPEVFERLKSGKHAIGNHTFNHLNGWNTPKSIYLDNFNLSEKTHATDLFRPPYGRILKSQREAITQTHKVVMWDILTGDYDPQRSPLDCLNTCKKYLKNGSIVVFHDSIKAENNLRGSLVQFIEFALSQGFRFEKLRA